MLPPLTRKKAFPSFSLEPIDYGKDTDHDMYPDFIDCQPKNPRKQGLGTFIKTVRGKVSQKLQEYKENEPNRREAELSRLRHQAEVMEQRRKIEQGRTETERARLALERERVSLRKRRRSLYVGRPSGLYANPFTDPSIVQPMPGLKKKKKSRRKRRR